MKWIKISKEMAVQPTSGAYDTWKPLLAEEGGRQCVYCAIPESSFGGTRNFHVEHYRPKSSFGSLTNDIRNLFYACAICNTFKGDDWPDEPSDDPAAVFYINPSLVDYNTVFFNSYSGEIDAKNLAGCYMLTKLYLNRPQLVLERREAFAYKKMNDLCPITKELIVRVLECNDLIEEKREERISLIREGTSLMTEANRLLIQRRDVVLYHPRDVSR